MRASVFGIGYVGAVSAGCLAKDGHQVIAVDPNEAKVAAVNGGTSPIVEPGLEEILADEVRRGRLRAISDRLQAILDTDITFVCVGTPSRFNGSLDTGYRAARRRGDRPRAREEGRLPHGRLPLDHPAGHDGRVDHPDAGARCRARRRASTSGSGTIPSSCARARRSRTTTTRGPSSSARWTDDAARSRRLADINAAMPVEPKVVPIKTAEAIKYINNSLARAQGQLLERDRQHLQGVRHRQPRGDGDPLRRHAAQHLARLHEAGLRLRRLLPAQGSPRASLPCARTRRADAGARRDACRQRGAAPPRLRHGRADRRAAGRPRRAQLQVEHRRSSREPAGRARRAALRQGLRSPHL